MAGAMLATSVTIVPSSIETITVRASNTVPAFGRSRLIAAISALRPFARATPSASPSADASTPITKPSTSTERRTCRRVAPSVRSVANSRVRWATVIESVLKMTNAPTNSATMPNASRKYWMKFVNSEMSFALALACSAPVFT